MRSFILIVLLAGVGCATTEKDDHRYPVQAIGYELISGVEKEEASAKVEENSVEKLKAIAKTELKEIEPSKSSFSKPSVTVRSADLESKSAGAKLDKSTKIYTSGDKYLQARDILEFKDLNESIQRGDYTLKKIQIIKTREGLEQYNEKEVYIWDEAF